jgi:predicted nucleic acid-binding protein
MTLVVDASVALKWFVAEPDSATALGVLASDEMLIAPDLVVAELCNAAWRLWRRNEMTLDQLRIIAGRASHAFAETAAADALAARAIDIAVGLDHPVHDCFYLALADLRDATMVTADRRLLSRVGGTPWDDHVIALEEFGRTK